MRVALITAPEMAEVAFVNKWVANYLYNLETLLPPLGLLYLAAYLERAKHTVKVLNITVFKYPLVKIIRDLKEFQPDLVGLSLSSNSFLKSIRIINEIKKELGVPIVVGGPHVIVYQEQSILLKNMDYAVYGEGEETLVELADVLEKGGDLSSIKGLVYKKDGRIIKNEARPLIHDLDQILFPAYHLIDFNAYRSARFGSSPFGVLFISRGCPHNCSFCLKNTTYRLRSVDNVMKEILFLHQKYGIQKIHFWDSTFTVSKAWIKEFAEKIQQLPFKLEYTCFTRVDRVDDDILGWLKQSGCINACYGIESFDQSCLDAMNKNTTPAQIKKVIDMTKKHDIRIHCMFIFGTPGETRKSIDNSVRFILNNFIEFIQIRPLQLMPGTKFYQDYLKEGGKDFWAEINHGRNMDMTILPVHSNFTKKQLDRIIRKTVLRYYLKPTTIYNMYKKKMGALSPAVYVKGFLTIASMLFQLF